MYEECGDAGLVCRRCGISRPTLRKWAKRYKQCGIAGLESQSRRPHSSPDTKVTDDLRALILTMCEKRNLGARRLQTELIRLHQIHLSTATLHKVLSEASVNPIVTYRRKKDFQTPIDRITEISDQTPLSEEVSQHYQIEKERFQEQNYKLDLQLRKLKPSL